MNEISNSNYKENEKQNKKTKASFIHSTAFVRTIFYANIETKISINSPPKQMLNRKRLKF